MGAKYYVASMIAKANGLKGPRKRRNISLANTLGRKDRYVMLSPRLLQVLRTYWVVRRPVRSRHNSATTE